MAVGGPELRLSVSFDLDAFKRTALPSLATAASAFVLPIAIKFSRDSITKELQLLGRQLDQRKYRIDLDDTSIKVAIENANKLASKLSQTKSSLAQASALGKIVSTPPGQQGVSVSQVRQIYSAAKELDIVSGDINRKRELLEAELKTGFVTAGKEAVAGLAQGLLSGKGELAGIAQGLGDNLLQALRNSLDIASPSKEMRRIGQQAGEGFNDGLIAALQESVRNAVGVMDSSLKKLDRIVERRQRKARAFSSADEPRWTGAQADLGVAMGVRDRIANRAEAIRLQASAGVFEGGSQQALSRAMQSLQIQASEIKPNTKEWNELQGRIASLNIELDKASTLAQEIQMRKSLDAFDPRSLAALESRLTILRGRAREIAPDSAPWKELNKEIQRIERGIEKASKKSLTQGQRLGAAGGAFLYGGGLGGGAGSAIGGIAGGLAAGVPGAFTGAAIGQAVDNLGAMTAAMVEQTVTVEKLKKGLATASNDFGDFAQSVQQVEAISTRLLLPVDQVYRKFTQLKASTVALGMDAETTGKMFEGTAAAVLRSGGSLDDVDGAMRAVVQVFSKGKLSAEELRGQLGERLPGAVVEFAQSAGMSVQELDKAFEQGTTSLDDFVNFLRKKQKEASGYANEMATSSEYAGQRMNKAFEKVRITIGSAFQPSGAAFQDFITKSIQGVDQLIAKLIELKLVQPGKSFYVGEALAGGKNGIKNLEEKILQLGGQQAAFKQNVPFAEYLPTYRKMGKELAEREAALKELRKLEALTKQRPAVKTGGQEDDTKEKERRSQQLLDAMDAREKDIADAKLKREEEIAKIRQDAIKNAKKLEEDLAKQRLDIERKVEKTRRDIAAARQDIGFTSESISVGLAGGDTDLIRIEQEITEAARKRNEDRIALEQEIADQQTERAKSIEALKKTTADAVNEANTRYAKAIGQAQQEYARKVAKIIEEGTERGGQRLALAANLAALYIDQATAKQAFVRAIGATIVPNRDNFIVNETKYTGKALIDEAQQVSESAATAAKDFVATSAAIQREERAFFSLLPAVSAVSTSVQALSVDTSDLTRNVNIAERAVTRASDTLLTESNSLGGQEFFQEYQQQMQKAVEDLIQSRNSARDEVKKTQAILQMRRQGVAGAQAESLYSADLIRSKTLAKATAAYESAVTNAPPNERQAIKEDFEKTRVNIQNAYLALVQFNDTLLNMPTDIKLNVAIADAQDELLATLNPIEQLKEAAASMGDSFSGAFKGIISSSMTAKEALASAFQSMADHFANMVSQMISKWLTLQVLEGFKNLFAPAGPSLGPVAQAAGIVPKSGFYGPAYANGGIALQGFTPFANGGTVNGPTLGLIGEGRYNEAIVPLPDGKSIPVELSKGNANNISTSIVVNIDGNGQSQSSMSSTGGAEFGRRLEGAMKQFLVGEMRPGGLLSGGR